MSHEYIKTLGMYWAPISFLVWAIVQSIMTVATVRRHDKKLNEQEIKLDNYERRISRLEGRAGLQNGR